MPKRRKCRNRRIFTGACVHIMSTGGRKAKSTVSVLTQRQALSQLDEPATTSLQGLGDEEAGPSRTVIQRTGDRNLRMCKKLNNKNVAESMKTIKMINGSLLRKTGIAVRKATTPKKRITGLPKPPTPADLRKKSQLRRRKSGRQRAKQ